MNVKGIEGRIINSANETQMTDIQGRKEMSEMVRNWSSSSYSEGKSVKGWEKLLGKANGCQDCPCDGKCSECACKAKLS